MCEVPKVYQEVSRRARKAHTCSECRLTIALGERYVRCSCLGDSWDDWPMCVTCSAVKDAWYDFGRVERIEVGCWEVGAMWEAIQFWIDERPAILAERERTRRHYPTTQVWATQPRSW